MRTLNQRCSPSATCVAATLTRCKKPARERVCQEMRVAYICNRYPAVSMTFVAREVEALRRLGVGVKTLSIRASLPADLLTSSDREAARETYSVLPVKWLELLGAHARAVTTHPLRYAGTLRFSIGLSSGGVRAGLWRLFYFAEAIVVWQRCRGEQVRHLHAHFANVATDVAMLCAHFADRPEEPWSWSFTLHGPVEFYDVYRAQLAEKIARATFVICISDFARGQAMAFSDHAQWDKLHVVHCGLDPEVWQPERAAKQSATHVLCVGRLISLKGHAVLIEAIARLRAEGVDVTATLVGDGPDRESLKRLARERAVDDQIEFSGSVGQDRIREHFCEADIFCLPSFAEGVPVVLMEAMAMGLPVISSQIMGIPELIEHQRCGLLTAPGRVDELADALRRLIGSRELRERLGRAGRKRVCAGYDIRHSAEQIEGLLRSYGVGGPAAVASSAETDSSARRRSASGAVDAREQEPASTPTPTRSLVVQNAGPPPGSDGGEA
jgi:glycosyltransferase involved in cell wall biosynthesis